MQARVTSLRGPAKMRPVMKLTAPPLRVGLVDSPERALKTGRRFPREDVIFLYVAGVLSHNRLDLMGRYWNRMLAIATDIIRRIATFGGHTKIIRIEKTC